MSHFGEKVFTYWHTDMLTNRQWWNHRTLFCLRAGVQKQRKTCFDPFLAHFPNFDGKKSICRKFVSVMHNFIWVSSTMPKFRKYNAISRKPPDRQMDRRMDGRTNIQRLFYRTLPAAGGGPITVFQQLQEHIPAISLGK